MIDPLYTQLAHELWKMRHPKLEVPTQEDLDKLIQELTVKPTVPHASTQLPLPSQTLFTELTTARNRNLITASEQEKLQCTVVAFFGLSVGSHSALTWMMTSRAKNVKIIDPDTIDASNLNRLRFGWDMVGAKKIDVVKQELEKINPYTHVVATDQTDFDSVNSVFTKSPLINLVVDAIDNLQHKLWLRQFCRTHRLPLVSAADVGDMVMLDIERHDLDPATPFFHNRLPDIENLDFSHLSVSEQKSLIIKLVGFEHNSKKMLESLSQIGRTLPTWPQLGATATMAGGIVANVIKKIILDEAVQSGRYYLSLDELLDIS